MLNPHDPAHNYIVGMILERAPTLNGQTAQIAGSDEGHRIVLTIRWPTGNDWIYNPQVKVNVAKIRWLDLLDYVDVKQFSFYVQNRCNSYLESLGLVEDES